MPKMKINAVIEAVRYSPDGQIDLVRAYERRGAVWSDVNILHRSELVDRLMKGQKFYSGSRKKNMGNQLHTVALVQLENNRVTSGGPKSPRDLLNGVPIF